MTGLDRTKLDQYLPDGPITSLRRIQTLYGALAEASSGDLIGGDPEFGLYYTPGELEGFTTSDPGENKRYLITVEVDLTAETVTAEDVNVDVDFLEPETVGKLGFARYPWGRGIDHSITRRGAKGGSDTDAAATYCIDCLERWTNADGREPAIGEVAKTHPDGWVIQLLQELGTEEVVQEKIRDLLHERYTDDERVVTTVKLRLDPEDLEEEPNGEETGWFYPGEIGVLNAGMKARKDDKLASKQVSTPSRGESACMVTGDRTEVFGTAEDPLAFFTLQHAEKFEGIRREQAWRSHPVSSDAALLIQSGSSLVDACRTTRNGLGVYTLPYFVDTDERDAEELYHALERLQEFDGDDQHPMFFLEKTIEEEAGREKAESLRFYVISLRNDSGDINVIHEVPDVSPYWPRKIASAHRTVLHESSAFGPSGFEFVENWQPITPLTEADDVVNSIVSGRYAWGTMPVMAGDEGAMADDLSEWLTYALLTGAEIPVERLLSGYVERIEQEYRDDEEDRLPTNHIKTQFAQLEALARAGLLTGDSSSEDLTTPPETMTQDVPTKAEIAGDGDLTRSAVRRYRLEQFIEERESLADNPHRKSAFLFGVLVGMVSYHQSDTRDMNRTVVDQYPPTQVTIDRLVRVWPELAEKSDVYAKDVGWVGTSLFPEVLDKQTEGFVHPGEWDLSLQDVRFFYALGVTFGKRADTRARDLAERIESEGGEPNDAEAANVA
ncbi:type I-B CRISPR-associated protein Cas8b/Csh1 [Halovivax limisalsi]|uniref:type I-B CRISPR-associated protein Cas8b/Csh1 n=1 Tax=Halovivax limisalsi TaxID=1453760 RepID=UPI001FFC67B6|nr:type I-B CRISPR-associated protein Cas8b/Csh1 [Halovivax limisalsi]